MFRRINAFWLVAIVVMAAASMVVQSPPASAQAGEMGFLANAFGTQVSVGSLLQSGRSALATLGCTSQAGVTDTNTLASVSTPVLAAGTLDTSAASQAASAGVASAGSSEVQDVRLLGGLVSATEVKSASTTSQDSSTGALSTSAAGTEFSGLSILGLPVLGSPAPNTRITLPGVGYVILNQQTGGPGKDRAGLTVIGIHVVVTLATPLASAGTQIIVSEANSGLSGPRQGLLSGLAYGASASLLGSLTVGELFPEALACFGTSGVAETNKGVSLSVPGILTSGTVSDMTEGNADPASASGETSSEIEGLNLLGGLVSATAIRADVTAAGNPAALGDQSSFTGLQVAGFPGIGDNPAPNTSLPLAGLGTLWLHRQIRAASSIKVIMVQLVVSVPGNPLGLPLGATINVGYARVGVS